VDAYRRAGVDLDAARDAVSLIRDLAAGASRPEVVEGVGGFAGLFRLDDGRLLAGAADGVGTKVDVARRAGRLDTVGIDLVAMCANDLVCTGAEPLFFLDYIVTERLVPEQVADLVAGVAEGCRRAGCALLGGETAEHPGHLAPGAFDLGGFCVGVVDEDAVLGPQRVRQGDLLVGLASSGLHSNGFSLVRKVIDERGVGLGDVPPGLDRPLVQVLLEPTEIYARPVLEAARRGLVRAAAHVTGGGLVENVPRALPDGVAARLDIGAWASPPVFDLLAGWADLPPERMAATFNVGLGMVLVAGPEDVEALLEVLVAEGARPSVVGEVVPGEGVVWR
jgi:phosphoribosylformylglycinamidine cyclo-ligase